VSHFDVLRCFVQRIAIIGLGLIGGSLALALEKAKKARGAEIVGFSRTSEAVVRAKECGAIDRAASDLVSAVTDVDVVIIATPVMATKQILASISEHLAPGCVVTDTGSTKVKVMEWAGKYLPPSVSFIGGHPMAGKETSGLAEASADLFKGCIYCLTPTVSATEKAVRAMERLVKSVGGRPFFIEAEAHDNLVAGVSHLPMLLSAAFVTTTTKSRVWPEMAKLAAGGYRDFSRLASGGPEMNCDICFTNQERIVSWLDRYIEVLRGYRHLVAEDSEELEKMLAQARESREKWLRRRKP
jgi:prephenate dehydrogenase